MKAFIIAAALALSASQVFSQASACMVTYYPPGDTSPEAQAFRLYPWCSQERERARATQRIRRDERTSTQTCTTVTEGNTVTTTCTTRGP